MKQLHVGADFNSLMYVQLNVWLNNSFVLFFSSMFYCKWFNFIVWEQLNEHWSLFYRHITINFEHLNVNTFHNSAIHSSIVEDIHLDHSIVRILDNEKLFDKLRVRYERIPSYEFDWIIVFFCSNVCVRSLSLSKSICLYNQWLKSVL